MLRPGVKCYQLGFVALKYFNQELTQGKGIQPWLLLTLIDVREHSEYVIT